MTGDSGKKCTKSRKSDNKLHDALSHKGGDDAFCTSESNSGKTTENFKTES